MSTNNNDARYEGIAENTLMQDELKQYFENNFKLGNLVHRSLSLSLI